MAEKTYTLAEAISIHEKKYAQMEANLEEALDRLSAQMKRGWVSLFGNDWNQLEGPSLDQLHEASKRNQEVTALNVHVQNGLRTIQSYVWDGDIRYSGIPGAKQGRGANVQARIDNEINQENFFSQEAKDLYQSALYTDGIVLYMGNESDFTLSQIPLAQITDDMRNPELAGEVWAYRRTWNVYKPGTSDIAETKSEWVYSNTFWNKRDGAKTVNYKGVNEPVSPNRMFVARVNRSPGWAYGVAEVQAALPWAEEFRDLTFKGIDMTDSMSRIWASVKNNTQAGADNAAVTIGGSDRSGGMAAIGAGQEISVLSSAGAAYDFSRLLPVLANFAAGIGISVVAVSSNPGGAGSSYGAAKTLDRPEQLSTNKRRKVAVKLHREILIWMGAKPEDLDVWFKPIVDEAEQYRAEQRVELRLGTGLHEGEDIKRMHAELDGRDPNKITPVPDGWLIPQNKESIELRTIDPNTNISGQTGSSASNGGGFTPTQGSGAKTVKSGSGDQKADDIRSREQAYAALIREAEGDEIKGLLIEILNRLSA